MNWVKNNAAMAGAMCVIACIVTPTRPSEFGRRAVRTTPPVSATVSSPGGVPSRPALPAPSGTPLAPCSSILASPQGDWDTRPPSPHGPQVSSKLLLSCAYVNSLSACSYPAFAPEKGVRVAGELALVVEELPPDLGGGGEVRQEVPERLHGEPAVVADVPQRSERRVPGDAARSGHATVVFRDVNVGDAAPRPPDSGRRILLFDMGMERVQVDAAVGVPHLIDEADGLVERVQVVQLESVDHFLGQHHACAGGILGHAAQVSDAARPLLVGGAGAGEDAEGYLVRAAQQGRSDRGAAVDHGLHVLVRGLLYRRVGAQRIPLRCDHCVSGPLQAKIVQMLPPARPLRFVEIKDRNLDTVVADPLQGLEHGQQAVVHVVRPQVQVDPELHRWPPGRSPSVAAAACLAGSHYSSAFTMNPASTSRVAQVT